MGKLSNQRGREGEDIAVKYLQEQGFEIIERNFHSQQGEIDIIAQEGAFLVFVEVKNYSYRSYGLPAAVVKKSKKQSIVYTARYYLYKNKIKGVNCRFDVLTIYRRGNGSREIELYRNAFLVN